jgi:hypothetical protein
MAPAEKEIYITEVKYIYLGLQVEEMAYIMVQ